MKAVLVLEDGSIFDGISVGVQGERVGEVVIYTGVVGYQEVMTDPANAGKIIVFTYPLIGNYGVARKFDESKKTWVEAIIIKEKSNIASNWQAEDSFDNFLKAEKVVAISEVDTRTLAVKIRDGGEMLGAVSTKTTNKSALLGKIKEYKNKKRDFIKKISVEKITKPKTDSDGPSIGIMDLGMPNSLITQLKALQCRLTLLPYDTGADKILSLKFDGLIISSGPENDAAIPEITDTVKHIIGKVPILGISLGHQIIALALGAKLNKLKLGHRGVNYPVKAASSLKGEITVQNHSLVVDEGSISSRKDIEITLRNINDNSIEEMESKSLKFISLQYCPASPGFDEVNEAFRRFLKLTGKKEKGPAYAKA